MLFATINEVFLNYKVILFRKCIFAMGDGMVWHSCYYTPLNFNRNEACANIIFLLARCGRKNNLCYHDIP